jgi:hypothetical protein
MKTNPYAHQRKPEQSELQLQAKQKNAIDILAGLVRSNRETQPISEDVSVPSRRNAPERERESQPEIIPGSDGIPMPPYSGYYLDEAKKKLERLPEGPDKDRARAMVAKAEESRMKITEMKNRIFGAMPAPPMDWKKEPPEQYKPMRVSRPHNA